MATASEVNLRQDVIDELEYEPSVKAAHIGVAVENGIVTLSGHVETYSEKQTAVTAAHRVKGVKAIADEIEVRFSSDKKTSDDQIAKRASDIINWDYPSSWGQYIEMNQLRPSAKHQTL